MMTTNAINRANRLLIVFSIVYALLEANIALIAPIITIVIPYRYLRYKDIMKTKENKKILSNLYIFNIISFIVAVIITKNINLTILDLMFNIFITFVYYKLLCFIDNKKYKLILENPEPMYEEINQKISVLEMLYNQTEELMENAETEKQRLSIKSRLEAINLKINDMKRQLEFLKKQVNTKNGMK